MLVEAYKAVVEWRELWEILEMKDGCIFKTRNTGKHVPPNADEVPGYVARSISADLGTYVTINPW